MCIDLANGSEQPSSRIIVVSNRLPVELRCEKGQVVMEPGKGGLITALAPILKNRGGVWIGWPGTFDAEEQTIRRALHDTGASSGFKLLGVYLNQEEINNYYYGFANEIMWPLLHNKMGACNFLPEYWTQYKIVNEKFVDTITQHAKNDDFIWVHDFHLMLVGQILKRRNVQARLGFFLHVPFPPPDVFLHLPWRFEILEALLSFDLIGVQTPKDRRNLIQCLRIMKPEMTITAKGPLHVCTPDHTEVSIGAFPISIDFEDFANRASSHAVTEEAWFLHEKWPSQSMILSVDRLDYTKGIPERLEGIRLFLTKYPEFHERVSFTQVIVPSRTLVPKYQQLKKEIDRLVGCINGEFSKNHWIPIYYLFHYMNSTELLAHYRTSEVALVTPLKDGMNLVCKEYIACNIEGFGSLILSEFAGAAAQLHESAIMVNPYNVEGIADALHSALTMSMDERRRRMRTMRRQVKRYDIYWWMKNYLNAAFGRELKDFPIVAPSYVHTATVSESHAMQTS